jgi:hypothetical protein
MGTKAPYAIKVLTKMQLSQLLFNSKNVVKTDINMLTIKGLFNISILSYIFNDSTTA